MRFSAHKGNKHAQILTLRFSPLLKPKASLPQTSMVWSSTFCETKYCVFIVIGKIDNDMYRYYWADVIAGLMLPVDSFKPVNNPDVNLNIVLLGLCAADR